MFSEHFTCTCPARRARQLASGTFSDSACSHGATHMPDMSTLAPLTGSPASQKLGLADQSQRARQRASTERRTVAASKVGPRLGRGTSDPINTLTNPKSYRGCGGCAAHLLQAHAVHRLGGARGGSRGRRAHHRQPIQADQGRRRWPQRAQQRLEAHVAVVVCLQHVRIPARDHG